MTHDRERRVVVAPDKFKGSLSAAAVAAAVGRGVRSVVPEVVVVEHPTADGGEGTVDMVLAHGYEAVAVTVSGPLCTPVDAVFAIQTPLAVIEMASAAGLALLASGPDEDTATRASTYGVGQMMTAALDRGAARIVLGVGGSATTDGGAGALRALGAELVDASGEPVAPGGGGLVSGSRLDLSGLDPRLAHAELVVACDVDNPLTGTTGAAAVYGPQKGATPARVAELDPALGHWADLVADATGRDLRDMPGAGAAGGLAFGLSAVLGARMTPGIALLLDVTGFDEVVRGADLVVVGEGSLDHQSLHGKGPVGVAQAAARHGVPVVAVVGRSTVSAEQASAVGIDAVYALTDFEPDERRSMNEAERLLEDVAATVAADRLTLT
ncbi:MAG TPA: glycerate kinase [Nocardioidaceae bacterium]|nr:glycerate kinase [Nocardioidaceae bacterium]